MFGAGGNAERISQRAALKAPDARLTNAGVEVGVFAAAFHHASPTRIYRDVQHGGERPVQARRRGFSGSGRRRFLHQGQVPGGTLAQRNREHGLVTMDHVVGEQQRDAQTRIFHHQPLQLLRLGGTHQVEHRAYLTRHQLCIADAILTRFGTRPGQFGAHRVLVQLTNFFLEGHA